MKQKQKFDELWNKLIVMTNEPAPTKKKKVKEPTFVRLFKEVIKDREELIEKELKAEIVAVLDTKLALDETIKKGEQELKNKEEKEYENFNKVLEKLIGRIEANNQKSQNMMAAAGGTKVPEPSNEDDKKGEDDEDKKPNEVK